MIKTMKNYYLNYDSINSKFETLFEQKLKKMKKIGSKDREKKVEFMNMRTLQRNKTWKQFL